MRSGHMTRASLIIYCVTMSYSVSKLARLTYHTSCVDCSLDNKFLHLQLNIVCDLFHFEMPIFKQNPSTTPQ